MSFRLLKTLSYFLVLTTCEDIDEENSLNFKILEDHSLMFPITHKELDSWTCYGASVLNKNKLILVPEVKDKKGAVQIDHNTPDNAKQSWIVDFRVSMGNNGRT